MWQFQQMMESTNFKSPFGIDPAIVDDGQTVFSVGIIATFAVADRDEDGGPDDAVYAADLQYLRAQIGDTDWNETMPYTGVVGEMAELQMFRPQRRSRPIRFSANRLRYI